jgi:two-component system chemotaxis sensor kinase CheA
MSDDSYKNFLDVIQTDFLEEATYLLDQCEESYLKLEKPEVRQDELRKIFWFCHFLKGAGVSIGYSDLSEVALIVEDLLCILLAKSQVVDSKIISVLLKVGDLFKSRINALKDKVDIPWDHKLVTDEVKQLIKKLGGSSITIQETNMLFNGMKPTSSLELPKLTEKVANFFSETKGASGSVKIDTDRIDAVLDIVGELVVLKSQLINETQKYHTNLKLNSLVALVEKSIRELQNKSLGLRMMPMRHLFLKTQRVVRDLSVKLDKPVDFEMSGEDTEIDRAMVDFLADPLLHIIRNAIDHGVEAPRIRQNIGKTPQGKITLSARQLGGRVLISISDDGGGIHRDKILKRVREKKLVPENINLDAMNNQEVYQFIFATGFSTAEFVSEISGRGVGMDVVRSNIEKLKGEIEIKTEVGKGTTFIISIPLTTSITDGMQIISGGQAYILPLDVIRELVDLKIEAVTHMHNGQEVLNVRGKCLPILDLGWQLRSNGILKGYDAETVGPSTTDKSNDTIVVVESNQGLIALRVESVIGQVQVVLKSLGGYFNESQGVVGASILSDGKVALVLDVDHLKYESPFQEAA